LRADIDYGFGEAETTYGIIGIKVWVYKGERLASVRSLWLMWLPMMRKSAEPHVVKMVNRPHAHRVRHAPMHKLP
jgi:ribosomal protein S3